MRAHKISISLPVFFSLLLVYLEAVFHIYEFGALTGGFFFTVLFSAMGGIFLGAFAGLFREKVSYIITIILTLILCVFFCVEVIYQAVFQNFLALFSMLGVAGQAFDFLDVIGKNIMLPAEDGTEPVTGSNQKRTITDRSTGRSQISSLCSRACSDRAGGRSYSL